MYKTKAYSAADATSPLAHTTIPRRDATPHDVQIDSQRRALAVRRHYHLFTAVPLDEAYDRIAKSDVKYRFSIDMASLKAE